ncbi:hypothetical protein M8J76_003103 [Diaphorina citri]|nr:hypothetical protein M8J75_004270 [Diaphorina citri]KAI5744532.1 hypothetical protein M8J76_003103 [Diaphorina citri]
MSLHDFRGVKEPTKLLFQFLLAMFYILMTIPEFIYSLISPPPRKEIKDKIVLITGAGSGLGRELALEFVKRGSQVLCADIQNEPNEETVRMLNEIRQGSAKAYHVDIGNEASVKELGKNVHRDFGKVDILINNAGILTQFKILQTDITDEQIQRLFNINITGHFRMVRAFLPDMVKRNQGHIVAISSMSSMTGVANASAYAASKWAVTGFMESLRRELDLNPRNQVKTTTVLPNFINTKPNYTARKIISNIRRDTPIFSVPEELRFMLYITKLLPMKIQEYFLSYVFYFNWTTPESQELVNVKNTSFKILSMGQATGT